MNLRTAFLATSLTVALFGHHAVMGQAPASRPVNPAGEVRSAVEAHKQWWYKAAPYPSDRDSRAIKQAVADGSTDPNVLFWRSRAIVREGSTNLNADTIREAMRLTKQAADAGLDAAIASDAGVTMRSGAKVTPEAKAEALAALQAAAQRDDSVAASELGECYAEGTGVKRNLDLAEKFLAKAVALGDVRSNRMLAFVRQKQGAFDRAFATLKKLAEAGDPQAQTLLGHWLMTGTATRRDPGEADRWLRKAMASGYPPAKVELAELLGGADRPADDHAEAVRLLEAAADENLFNAELRLAEVRLYGQLGTAVDPSAAERLYRTLAASGDAEGNYQLGIAELNGLWLPRDRDAGVRHLQAAAAAGSEKAKDALRLFEHISE